MNYSLLFTSCFFKTGKCSPVVNFLDSSLLIGYLQVTHLLLKRRRGKVEGEEKERGKDEDEERKKTGTNKHTERPGVR
jgi:hypothetical protein